ncbi:hypothetical protein DW986_03145 [Parabacteroides merdae]|jgi:hypothetical protein|uniref:Phage major capsid protein n=1 Tax=Parabacteroides merdae TaxID=46503 RepID=A0A3R5ZPW4_9BACT|nr:hypothetical protein [Parabacteroides merdae]RGZ50275.1 hypothetical protein DW986_03145 [Parabacteroides merdae]RHH74697.1 hypothetical protein DW191_17435 [Parabacteroides merdae]DAY51087.1 MAG TPA: Major capsid protein [Caudoviricetes sp.]
MAIEKQIWISMLMEGFYPSRTFLARSVDMTAMVEYNKINLAEAGVAPEVLVDNTTFPVPTASRTDVALELPLHTFDTKNTVVRNVEAMELAYDKMDSVVRQHRNTLQAKTAAFAANSWAPQTNKDLTPVKATSGADNNRGVKSLSFQDILDLDAWFRSLDIDPSTMVAVLNPYHLADLMAEDMKLYKEMLTGNKIFGFDLYTFSQLPYYNATSGAKVAFGTAAQDTDTQCSLFYCADEVMRADGDIEVFAKYKDPGERGDVIGFQKRFTALPIRNKYQAAIYSAKSSAAASGGGSEGQEDGGGV